MENAFHLIFKLDYKNKCFLLKFLLVLVLKLGFIEKNKIK